MIQMACLLCAAQLAENGNNTGPHGPDSPELIQGNAYAYCPLISRCPKGLPRPHSAQQPLNPSLQTPRKTSSETRWKGTLERNLEKGSLGPEVVRSCTPWLIPLYRSLENDITTKEQIDIKVRTNFISESSNSSLWNRRTYGGTTAKSLGRKPEGRSYVLFPV